MTRVFGHGTKNFKKYSVHCKLQWLFICWVRRTCFRTIRQNILPLAEVCAPLRAPLVYIVPSHHESTYVASASHKCQENWNRNLVFLSFESGLYMAKACSCLRHPCKRRLPSVIEWNEWLSSDAAFSVLVRPPAFAVSISAGNLSSRPLYTGI